MEKALIWSRKDGRDAWYRPGAKGYTVNRWEAGRFDRADAEERAAAHDYLDLHDDVLPYNLAAHEVTGKEIIYTTQTWQCLGCGRVYLGDRGESMARYCCHTHRCCCDCGTAFETRNGKKGWLTCGNCRAKKESVARAEKVAKAELVDEGPLVDYMVTDGDGNYWPSTDEYLEELADMDEPEPYEFLFVAEFRPVLADMGNLLEDACDDHAEDISDSLITDDLQKAVDAFNALCAEARIGSFFEVAKKVRVEEAEA